MGHTHKIKCVADTSTIIKLRKGGVIHLLDNFFEVVYLPNAVKNKCRNEKTKKVISGKTFNIENVFCIQGRNIHKIFASQ